MKKSQRSKTAAKRGAGRASSERTVTADKPEPSTCADGNTVNTTSQIGEQEGSTELQRDLAHFIRIIAAIHAERICPEPLDTES
ncbi:MAG: hypothetical protein IAE83_00600 [Anaerolinea sp.]|nr:hypothetical protein [Anaerolinea sp.]CAG0951849.1 hypothetical protein ANRL4_00122 [Anaerolineae bacterium]